MATIRAQLLVATLTIVFAACNSGGASPGGTLSCKLGGGCSPTAGCTTGVEGCSSNCQCLDGTWQAPCPVNPPQTGSPCTSETASCRYATTTNACGGEDCYCQQGTWSCEPSCILPPDASVDSTDAGETPGAAACAAAGGECVRGASFCGNVGPGADAASCQDVALDMLCCDVSPDAGCTVIEASSYDQSCTSDPDCAWVYVGSGCHTCAFSCGPDVDAINVGALAQYAADVRKTPAGVLGGCSCAFMPGPPVTSCCRGGKCHAGSACRALDGSTGGPDSGSE